MALFRTLNTLRRDAVQLALHTLGLRRPAGKFKPGAPRIFGAEDRAVRRPAVLAVVVLVLLFARFGLK